MSERLQPNGSGHRTARWRPPRARAGNVRDAGTLPAPPPAYLPADTGEPTILGFPADVADDVDGAERATGASPAVGLAVLRRADPVAAGALVLAGVAANVSLLLSWSPGDGPTGLWLVRHGVEALGFGAGEAQSSYWQPPVVVVSGGVLVLLGLLLLIPARTHRLIGVLALMLALAAAAAVTLLVADSALVDDRLGPGMWCAFAVPVFGLLGSLKAMLTVPLVTLRPRRSTP